MKISEVRGELKGFQGERRIRRKIIMDNTPIK
jgi:hypothetical protein